MKDFWSIEYTDEEGDQIVVHGFLTDEEAKTLLEAFAARGLKAEAHRLSANVSSRYALPEEGSAGLEAPLEGLNRRRPAS